MQKKSNRLQARNRQRQKIARKLVILIAASTLTCMVIGLTIFFHGSRVDDSMAAVNIYTVAEDAPVVDKTLDAPILRQIPVIGPNTVLVRPVKAMPNPAHAHHN
jgi:hypothetical protein